MQCAACSSGYFTHPAYRACTAAEAAAVVLQDMACETFLKICHKCKRKFVVIQVLATLHWTAPAAGLGLLSSHPRPRTLP
jgi:hypothetical protein